jgi:hypothetical protein
MKIACLIFISLIRFSLLQAQHTDSTIKKNFNFSGFVDFYYNYDFDKPANKLRPDYIYNHKRHNQPNINLALLKASFNKNKLRANLGLMAGTYAQYNLATEPDWAQLIYEANLGYDFSNKFSAEAGIMPSHLGLESAISKNNWNLSRSLLAENSPYYETGVKLNFTPNKKWKFSLLGLNGWQHIKDNNSSLALGTHVQFTPNEKWLFNSSSFIGNEKPDPVRQLRFFHNFYTSYTINKRLNTSFYFDYGFEKRPAGNGADNWWGVLWKFQWKAFKKINTAFRYEYFNDPAEIIISHVSANGIKLSGFSANIDWQIAKNILWRNELRLFYSADNIFTKDNLPKRNNTNLLSSLALWF